MSRSQSEPAERIRKPVVLAEGYHGVDIPFSEWRASVNHAICFNANSNETDLSTRWDAIVSSLNFV